MGVVVGGMGGGGAGQCVFWCCHKPIISLGYLLERDS